MASSALSTTDDLDAAWAKVVAKFQEEAHLKPASQKHLSISDVLAQIAPQDAAPDTQAKAKAVVGKVLVCVQRFGDFIASASSVVFGGSQQCFNALSFVITATQNYGRVFDDLTTLMERVSIFLETLRIYLDGEEESDRVRLDARLRPNVYRVLEHFMTILTLATRLTTRKGKVRVFAKVFFFGEDGGVTAALATLETRVSDVVRIQVAVIGKDLSEAARDIRVMKADMDLMLEYDRGNAEMLERLDSQESRKRSDEAIRAWLNLDRVESERDLHVRLNEERVPGSGSWLFAENEDFGQWCDVTASGSTTILITGERGRGKTFLASAVVEHIRERLLVHQSTKQLALAYFYAQEDSSGHGGLSQINRALRSMAWQLAKSNPDFYDYALGCSEGDLSINTSDQVWDTLFAGYNPKSETIFYFVLDGIEAPAIGRLKPESSRLQTRMFVTANSQAAHGLEDDSDIVHIPLGADYEDAANFEDVQKLISLRLSSMPIFHQDTSSLSNRQEQQRVLESVSANIQNDFPRLDLVFRELELCYNLRQLNDVLNQVNEPIEVKITRQIDILNQTLTQDEILEVNTIISCVASFATGTFKPQIDLVEQYVDVVLRGTRLAPLKGHIETKYHHLFAVDAHGTVSWRYDGMERYLKEYLADDNTIKAIHAKRGIRSVGLDLEELDLLEKIVQTNLSNVLGKHGSELFDKYGFADFFRSKRGQHKETICFDQEKSRVLALWVALKVLCDEPDRAKVALLRRVAQRNLNALFDLAQRDQATDEQVERIEEWLEKLLSDDRTIDTFISDPDWSKVAVRRKGVARDWLVDVNSLSVFPKSMPAGFMKVRFGGHTSMK
ncbi:hypothetical protein K491DRAFT_680807 [Lophiostoma macrostomum CBS 122681]|uniref:Uncharacterized protein n=1 Tax=Lophiostoma macrostomum CBS 122681 TaxID=1314788 RepID=A0A6A6SZJ0_9PLEO|nr:hypothetical protein K491DRAFT_680807 [Lophiostoma macrostomum CBS 122681]